MFKTAAHLPGDLNRLTRETGMLLATVDSLTDDEFAAPSKCEGWARAHVVAHLALGADAMGNMITWGTTGVETPPYVSWDARNADIENLAKKSPAEIKAALHTAVKNFADKAATLQNGLKVDTVKTGTGADINPYAVPALRISEVIIHHADLDTVWELEEADIDALEDTLGSPSTPMSASTTSSATAPRLSRVAVMRSSGGWLGGRPTASGTTASCPSALPGLWAEPPPSLGGVKFPAQTSG